VSKEDFLKNGRSIALQAEKPQSKSLRILNAFMPTIGSLDRIENEIPGIAERGFNIVYISPLLTSTQNGFLLGDVKTKQIREMKAGSPYAMTDGRLNKAYTKGGQLGYDATKQRIREFHQKAQQNGVAPFYDCVLNHIGHDCLIFDTERRKELYDDPVFGKMARAADEGKIDIKRMFRHVDEKRNPEVSGEWNDVREFNLETDDDIDDFVEYFAVPYVQAVRDYAIDERDEDSTLDLRFDAAAEILLRERGWQAGHAWWKIAQAIVPICQSKNGRKPEFIFENIGSPADRFKPVLQAFPEDMQAHLHHFSPSMWGVTGHDKRERSPLNMIDDIAQNNFHDFYNYHAIHKETLGHNQIAIIGTHDLAYDPLLGTNLNSYLKHHCFMPKDQVAARKMTDAIITLSAPNHMRPYGEHFSFTHEQPEFWKAKPIDYAEHYDLDAVQFMTDLNATHEAVHEGRNFAWNEVAFQWGYEDRAMMIFHPEEGLEAPPVMVLVPTGEKRVSGKETAEIYKDNCVKKKHPDVLPQEIHVLGGHQGVDWVSFGVEFPEAKIFHNGIKIIDPEELNVFAPRSAQALKIA
jgi:hypothetical protein